MPGICNGTQQKLKETVGHDVPCMPCLSHLTSSTVEHRYASSDLINELFLVLESLHVFFASSPEG